MQECVITARGLAYPIDFSDLVSEKWKVEQSAYKTDVRVHTRRPVRMVEVLSMSRVMEERLPLHVHAIVDIRPARKPAKTACSVS
jgi:hypothetical protein